MKPTGRMYKYASKNFNEVKHTTLNPKGPGVVRIHMIPPKYSKDDIASSVVIINGQDIIPVNTSWSILLGELIDEINEYHGKPVTDEDVNNIIDRTCARVKKVYPLIRKSTLKNDIVRIMDTFTKVAYGQIPDEEIGYLHMGEYAQYMQAPHRMDLMVSAMTKDGNWHCNQKCLHCYAAGQAHGEEEELTTDEWLKILDILRNSMVPQVTFTGGEPTMREDLFELLEHAKWFVTRLNTNGIKLTRDYCERLMSASLDSIQITFYSENEEIHNKLVGAEQYRNTVNGIENALEAGLSVSINTPLCSLNKDYVKTLEFLHDKGVTYVTCSGLITTGNALQEDSVKTQLDRMELKEILKEAAEYCFSHDMELSFTSPGWIENEFFKEIDITTPTCGACLSNMAVTPAGNVVPCQSWLSGEPLGNIMSDDWNKIWNSSECKNRRAYSAMMTGRCPLRVNSRTEESTVDSAAGAEEDNTNA